MKIGETEIAAGGCIKMGRYDVPRGLQHHAKNAFFFFFVFLQQPNTVFRSVFNVVCQFSDGPYYYYARQVNNTTA